MIPAEYQPYLPYAIMALNGLVAGWLASLILGGGGLLRNLIVGVIGAFVGGALAKSGYLPLPESVKSAVSVVPYGYGEQITVSTIGAIIVVLLARFLGR